MKITEFTDLGDFFCFNEFEVDQWIEIERFPFVKNGFKEEVIKKALQHGILLMSQHKFNFYYGTIDGVVVVGFMK